ncbi:hypothetical protein [Variovorax sp. Root473]|uniref:hypothetical protein n=1 Tax=Variovorax sp. Root473 TaxID=1736541 RepID=UPI0012F8ECEF|nr:hypothetical protein [Variovorax sp. Root473]
MLSRFLKGVACTAAAHAHGMAFVGGTKGDVVPCLEKIWVRRGLLGGSSAGGPLGDGRKSRRSEL